MALAASASAVLDSYFFHYTNPFRRLPEINFLSKGNSIYEYHIIYKSGCFALTGAVW